MRLPELIRYLHDTYLLPIDAGPLAPGDAAVINALMRGKAVCIPLTWNCARTWWEVNGQAELDDMDCAEVPIRGSGNRIYLPLELKAPS